MGRPNEDSDDMKKDTDTPGTASTGTASTGTDTSGSGMDRRAFLRGGLSAGAAGAVVVATAGAAGAATETPAEPRDKPDAHYRETEHVRRVYDLARF